MENIVPRAQIEPTPLAFWVNMLTVLPPRLPEVIILPTPTCLCGSLPERSGQTFYPCLCLYLIPVYIDTCEKENLFLYWRTCGF